VSSSIGASAGTFLCEQPLAQGKRKSAGKRRRRGAAAMLSPTLEESDSLRQKKGARTFGEKAWEKETVFRLSSSHSTAVLCV